MPTPILRDSEPEDENPDTEVDQHGLYPVKAKKIKLEQWSPSPSLPLGLPVIKKEPVEDDGRCSVSATSSSSMYTSHAAGGLRVVIKNSPVHMKSPGYMSESSPFPQDQSFSSSDIEIEEVKSPRKERFKQPKVKKERGAHPGAGDATFRLPFSSPRYNRAESQEVTVKVEKVNGIKCEPEEAPDPSRSVQEEEEEEPYVLRENSATVPFTESAGADVVEVRGNEGGGDVGEVRGNEGGGDVGEGLVYEAHSTLDSSLEDGAGYVSSQDEGETSEADAAVAGLLSSTGMDTDEDISDLMPHAHRHLHKDVSRTNTGTAAKDTGGGYEMSHTSPDNMDYTGNSGNCSQGGDGELSAAVDSLMADLNDINGANQSDVTVLNTSSQSPDPSFHGDESHYVGSSNVHQSDEDYLGVRQFSEDQSGVFLQTDTNVHPEEFFSTDPNQSDKLIEMASMGDVPGDGSGPHSGHYGGLDTGEATEPSLNEEMQSAINSILSLQQLGMTGDSHSASSHNQTAQCYMDSANEMDIYLSGTEPASSVDEQHADGTEQDSNPSLIQDDLDAAVQSILM